ncbi:nucleoside/nucleotide kinase family protein [Jeotgalibacillus campisalis]|uniref:Uncharacterized protein n=1 Tax=Jeotgalibacillus campisalis TaxID=220754 RepID=A0A0C2VU77_9BACL|nr:hypothetical protein [Jeotgalibacillus campisalis]KIL47976.1 hypothetical protein KR50_21430 [Jeotgalibacillus campisalis]
MNLSSDQLLEAYELLWNNRTLDRSLPAEESTVSAIKRELQDELTHPRVRVKPDQKFYQAVERIVYSSLSRDEKIGLIQLYTAIFHEITD